MCVPDNNLPNDANSLDELYHEGLAEKLLSEENNDQLTDQNDSVFNIEKNLPSSKNFISDEELDNLDKKNLDRHNDEYSKLLELYVKDAGRLLTYKYLRKISMYNIFMGIFIAFPIVLICLLFVCSVFMYLNNTINGINIMIEVVSTFGTIIASHIVIIKMMARYLFNENEDKTMTQIITKIQEYDITIRNNRKSKD